MLLFKKLYYSNQNSFKMWSSGQQCTIAFSLWYSDFQQIVWNSYILSEEIWTRNYSNSGEKQFSFCSVNFNFCWLDFFFAFIFGGLQKKTFKYWIQVVELKIWCHNNSNSKFKTKFFRFCHSWIWCFVLFWKPSNMNVKNIWSCLVSTDVHLHF